MQYLAGNYTCNISQGTPYPLGATFTDTGVNFSIFAHHAQRVSLVLFRPNEEKSWAEIPFDPKINRTDDNIWHIHVDDVKPGFSYGYKIDGKHDSFHLYNEKILLIDPYSKALDNANIWGWPISETKNGIRLLQRRSLLIDTKFNWENDKHPHHSYQKTVIYEIHVRGFTQDTSSGMEINSGTYTGIIRKLPYLKELGITAIELLPIAEFDENDNDKRNPETSEMLKNYWGYHTISFFAPKASFCTKPTENRQIIEFQEMVKACHKENIEVILDIVLNHTAEGNKFGPILHFKGIDNCAYYLLNQYGEYQNYSGCGNTINANHPAVIQMILDCLRFWVQEMHVDGFRFDLASAMIRDSSGNLLTDPPLIRAIAQDTILAQTKIIAEPWDASGLYNVGSFPHYGKWAEWNGRFRDDVRSFIKGDDGYAYAVAQRLIGSPDIYQKSKRPIWHSINFITCHDGFTLYDLVSYNQKHNFENDEKNCDGSNDNRSWNCGEEGTAINVATFELRQKQMKNFLALLFIAQGIPMLLGGDEFARTQKGNNNAYCQDNQISWINWNYQRKNKDILRFTKEMIAFRHRQKILHKKDYSSIKVHWHGTQLYKPDWSYTSHTIAFVLEAMPQLDENEIYVALNAFWQPLEFQIPKPISQKPWRLIVNTSLPSPQDFTKEDYALIHHSSSFLLPSRSLIVLLAK